MDINEIRQLYNELNELHEEGYRYITKNWSGITHAHKNKPSKVISDWGLLKSEFDNRKTLWDFDFGTSWEDEEATLIEDKIKEFQNEMFKHFFGEEIAEYEKSVKKADEVITNSDMVNSPNHYTWKSRECKYIQADMVDGLDGMVAHHMADVIKYLYRVGHKDDIKQDLEKAKKNIDFIIEEMTKGKQA